MTGPDSSAGYIGKPNPNAERERDQEAREADEDLLDKLDDDFELGGLRQKRIEMMRQESVLHYQRISLARVTQTLCSCKITLTA